MTHVELDGQTIAGRYEVREKVGEGGMGSVYRGYDAQLQREVALKVLRKEWVDRPEVLRRLDRECLHMAKMGAHSNIVTLYDRLEHEGSVILVIEYVDGEPLDVIIKRTGEKQSAASAQATVPFTGGGQEITLDQDGVIAIAAQCLVGLSHAHGCGVIHRDIKPSNVLVMRNHSGDLQAKVLDFGIGKAVQDSDDALDTTALTRPDGPGPGSPPYMAPEQIAPSQFGDIGPQTDLYAMGVTLYEMLTLQLPFEGKSVTEFLVAHTSMEPRNPRDLGVELSPEMAKIVRRALRKPLDERYQSAEEFRADLEGIKNGAAAPVGGTMVTPVGDFSPPRAPAAKKGFPVGMVAGLAAAVLIVAGGSVAAFVLASGNGGEEDSSEGGSTAASVVPAPGPAPSEPRPIDDGPVAPGAAEDTGDTGDTGELGARAEAAKRKADDARADARAEFGDARNPADNSNYRLGTEAYDQGVALLASGGYWEAEEHFRDAADFFDGARPAPVRTEREPDPVVEPEPEPAPRVAEPPRTAPEPAPAPPPRPATARQDSPASPPAASPAPRPAPAEPSNPFERIRATPTPESD